MAHQKKPDESSGISQGMATALLGILPTIAGGLLGGDAGVAVGSQVGIKAMGQYTDAQLAQRAYDQNVRQYDTTMEYKRQQDALELPIKLRSQEIALSNLNMRERELQTSQSRFADQSARGDRNYQLEFDKASQLSEKQVVEVEKLSNFQKDLEQVGAHALKAGPAESQIRQIGANLGLSQGQDFDTLRNEILSIVADRVKLISGTAASHKERIQLQLGLPSLTDSPDLFLNNLKSVTKKSARHLQAKLDLISAGQPLKKGSVERVRGTINSGPSNANQLRALLKK